MNLKKLLIEGGVVGLLTVFFGYLVIYVMKLIRIQSGLGEKVDKQTKMIVGLFILGVLLHLVCEFTGVNKWYCKNGHACLKK